MSSTLPVYLPSPLPPPPSHQNQPASFSLTHPQPVQDPNFTIHTTSTTNPTPTPSPSTWVETLRSHARSNSFHSALSTYINMTSAGVPPDHFAFPAALKAATGLRDLLCGKQLHAAVILFGYNSSRVTVANTLITMYAKCGDIESAAKVFDRMPERDQVSWNSMIAALCLFEEWELSLGAFRIMQEEQVAPSSFTLVSVALACSNLGRLNGLMLGKQVHAFGLRAGLYSDGKTFTYNALMAMYAKLGKVEDSAILFHRFDYRDTVTWNTIISALVQNDRYPEAIALLRRMVHSGIKPDGVTLSSVLPACSQMEMLDAGREIHAFALRNDDLSENSFVASALLDLYCNFENVEKGRHVFDGVVEFRLGLWNAMICGYAQNGLDEEALKLFIEMEVNAGLRPNATTIAGVLPACVRSELFSCKEAIHGYVIKRGLACDKYVQNALMDMYSRVGKMAASHKIFDGMGEKDTVSWNTMITGYLISGLYSEAFDQLIEMQRTINTAEEEGESAYTKPNHITLMTVLPACASLSALGKGKEIHGYAIRNKLDSDVAVGSALVDMYAKCGCLVMARRVFDRMPKRNVITWNVLILAYGMHGHGEEALQLFDEMMTAAGEVRPNEVTLIATIAACSHSGMVSRGVELFRSMREDHGFEPLSDHYACVVDLLGRAGQLEEAYRLINTEMGSLGPHQAGAWSSLLGACRLHQEVKLGEIAARHLFQLEPEVASHYVLLSNIYAAAGQWKEAMEVRKKMKEMGVRKEPGCSWIEVGDEVHEFMVGDSLHPQSPQLHSYLETLREKMRREGYVPDTSCVLHDVEEDEKEMLLCGHSEKLAIAFGILNLPSGSTIRVAKNLRVCNDCHEAAKFISKIVGREIVLRDTRRFHHFRDGSCSCGDYW